jgi:hypothetical protein
MPDQRISSIRRWLRFSLKQLFLAVAFVAVGLWAWNWLYRKVVVVRAWTSNDRVVGSYLGYPNDHRKHREFAVVTGKFTTSTVLSACSFVIRSGAVEKANQVTVGRSTTLLGRPYSQDLTIPLAISEMEFREERVSEVNVPGDNPGGYARLSWHTSYDVQHNIRVVARKTIPDKITPGRRHIVYVEGDTEEITADGSMTVEDFAKANPGNYLVVTVELQ